MFFSIHLPIIALIKMRAIFAGFTTELFLLQSLDSLLVRHFPLYNSPYVFRKIYTITFYVVLIYHSTEINFYFANNSEFFSCSGLNFCNLIPCKFACDCIRFLFFRCFIIYCSIFLILEFFKFFMSSILTPFCNLLHYRL